MAKTSGGLRTIEKGGLQPGDATYEGRVANIEPLVNIKNAQVYKEAKAAIARYHSVMGVRQTNVKLADMSAGVLGVHRTTDGRSEGVYLNKTYFNQTKNDIVSQTQGGYKSGWSTITNKPMAHTITHELAHATWNNHLSGAKHNAAGVEIRKLYTKWRNDTKKSGYGKYAKTNVNEFWAETVTKAVHGTPDYYTKRVKAIAKKYKL